MTQLESLVKLSKQIILLDKQIVNLQKMAEQILDTDEEFIIKFSLEKIMKATEAPVENPPMDMDGSGLPPSLMDMVYGRRGPKVATESPTNFTMDRLTTMLALQVIAASFTKKKSEIESKMKELAKELA